MEALIRPEFGLMFWTIFIFILLVLILSKTAWKPLMKAVEEREHGIRHDREAAEKARLEAEKIKEGLEAGMAALKIEIEARLNEARASGVRERDLIIEDARKSAALLIETAKTELESQKNAMVRELKDKVAELALLAAERVLQKTIDQKADRELVNHFLKELESGDARYKLGK
ncbi:MAG: F0F1 ATP synthase subunit B [Elusimicrobiota bacterium]